MRITLRPKTRAALISYVDEDLEQVAEALRDRSKSLKKWHAKLKAEFDGKKDDKMDSDSELKEPRTDEDYSDRDNNNDDTQPPPLKRGRSRRPKGRSVSTIIRMRRTRFRNQLPVCTDAEIFPIARSELEYDHLSFKVGDVVKVRSNKPAERICFAQIRGFYRDQFCGKYAALQWLCPSQPKEPLLNVMDVFDPAYFIQGQTHNEPVELGELIFVKRISPSLVQTNPHDQKMILTKEGKKEYMDGVTNTVSSLIGISRI